MTITLEHDMIRLQGHCGVEEAEQLLGLLQSGAVRVDWSGCTGLHTALVQLLLAAGQVPDGTTDDPFLARFVLPALRQKAQDNDRDLRHKAQDID
jgi:hypothetical protein